MRLWAEALDMRTWHPEIFASRDAPSRGVTAVGGPAGALFKALADSTNLRRFAEFVKGERIAGLPHHSRGFHAALRAEEFMGRFGTTVYGTFLDQAWPQSEDEQIDRATWGDVVEVFFENAKVIKDEAARTGHVWDERAIAEVDGKLLEIAQSGQFSGIMAMSPEAMEEVWRRWSYAITAAELERRFGRELNLPIPRNAPPELKGAALVLYVLAGPAHDYRREIYQQKPHS